MYRLTIYESDSDVIHVFHASLDDILWFLDRVHFGAGFSFRIKEV